MRQWGCGWRRVRQLHGGRDPAGGMCIDGSAVRQVHVPPHVCAGAPLQEPRVA